MSVENILNKKLKANIWKLYICWFCNSLIFAYVIERLFNLERGLTVKQMVYLEIIYAGVVMVLEIPSGVIADYWSRKNIIIISTFFAFFELFILIFAFDFWIFALSISCAAVSGALESGAANALLYDSLKMNGKEDQFEKIMGRDKLLSAASGLTAALFGSYIGSQYGYVYTYWLSLIGVAVSIIVTFTLTEPPIRNEISFDDDEEGSLADFDFWEAIRFFRNNTSVSFVIAYCTVIAAVITYIDEYWQIYLNDISFPVYLFGVFSFFYFFVDSISGLVAYKLKDKFDYKQIFSVVILAIGFSILVSGTIPGLFGCLLLFIAFLGNGIIHILSFGYMHKRTPSKYRATVESFASLALRVVTILTGLIFGYICTEFNVFSGFQFLGIFILIYAVYYLFFQFRYLGGAMVSEALPEN